MASGSCGFVRELAGEIDVEALGGFVTKSVTVEPRWGNDAPRITEEGGAMLNSVGLANPGLASVKREHLPWIARNVIRPQVFVSVAGRTPREFAEIANTLDSLDGFLGYELNLSCPNALSPGGGTIAHDPAAVARVVAACREATGRTLLAKLGPSLPDVAGSARAAENAGADGLTLVNTLPATNGKFREAAARLGSGAGGVSGPPLRAYTLDALGLVAVELPLIAVGGISNADDALCFGRAGARLVQACTAAFADPRAPGKIVAGLRRDREPAWSGLAGA